MGMFGQIRNSVNSILPRLYNDEDLVVEVTWRKFINSVFNDVLGFNEDTYVDYTVNAIKLEKENTSSGGVRSSGVAMSVGDIVYLFRYVDLPSGISTRDVIVEDSNPYSVTKIYPVYELVTKVEVRGYA